MAAGDDNDNDESALVQALTSKLEQLQGLLQSPSLSDDLREQLVLLQQRQQHQQQLTANQRARAPSLSISTCSTTSSSSSNSTPAGGNSSSSFTSSPIVPTSPGFTSPVQHHVPIANGSQQQPVTSVAGGATQSFGDAGFAAMMQENQRLKAQLEASEQARSRQGREVAELKRQLGMISLDELESLDVVGSPDYRRSSSYARERDRSVVSGGSNMRSSGGVGVSIGGGGGTSNPLYSNGVRIPGTTISSSFSPPSSFMSRRAANGGFSSSYTSQQQHYYLGPSSRGSSLNTAFTTPSSSYPQPFPPPTSPASSVASWNALGFPPSAFNGTRAPPPSSAGSAFSYLRSPSARRRRRSLSEGQGIDEAGGEQTTPELYEADEDDGDGDDPSGGLTPLSTSPGSRSGSLSRRTSISAQTFGAGTAAEAGPSSSSSGIVGPPSARAAGGAEAGTSVTSS